MKYEQCPPAGWTTTAVFDRNYDSDTPTLEIRKKLNIRLLECYAPEIRSKSKKEKELAIKGRDFVNKMLKEAKEIKLFIPTDGEDNIADVITLGRFLGYVFVDGVNLSYLLVKEGYAVAKPPKKDYWELLEI